MAPSNRATQFTHLHKVLKGFYKPVAADAQRPVLEHLLFACVLENAHYGVAEEAFAAIGEMFFDWNEIRVSSIRELAEVMARLPDPPAAAARLKAVLQHVFEASYSFDLEHLRKQNLGPATQTLQKIKGVTGFGAAYVVQSALGGHAIPLDAGTLEVMRILDLASDAEVAQGNVTGLERAIPKNKGVEFGSLLHQLGADLTDNPFAADLREKLLAIDPKAKPRFPKRTTRKKAKETQEPPKAAEPAPAAKESPKPKSTKKKTSKKATKKISTSGKKVAKKKIVPTKKKVKSTKKKTTKKKASTGAKRKKSATSRITKKKPR
ncbi:MAG: hypothetical protein JW818_23610 [Pirellulales bacterium]|nr:hypothetical protein [Pirellulales bacterium]